jgi:hypothetical protein
MRTNYLMTNDAALTCRRIYYRLLFLGQEPTTRGILLMPRLGFFRIGACLLVASAGVSFVPGHLLAFEMENPAATVPGGTAFQDPDEQLLTAPPKDDSLQLKTDNSDPQAASGTTLQLAPGTTLQITDGSAPSMNSQAGLPFGPTVDTSNPADNQSLIPSP